MQRLEGFSFPEDFPRISSRNRLRYLADTFGVERLNWFKAPKDFDMRLMDVISHPSVRMVNLGIPTHIANYYVTDDDFIVLRAKIVGFDTVYNFGSVDRMLRTMLYTEAPHRNQMNEEMTLFYTAKPIYLSKIQTMISFKNGKINEMDELFYSFDHRIDIGSMDETWKDIGNLPSDASGYAWYHYVQKNHAMDD